MSIFEECVKNKLTVIEWELQKLCLYFVESYSPNMYNYAQIKNYLSILREIPMTIDFSVIQTKQKSLNELSVLVLHLEYMTSACLLKLQTHSRTFQRDNGYNILSKDTLSYLDKANFRAETLSDEWFRLLITKRLWIHVSKLLRNALKFAYSYMYNPFYKQPQFSVGREQTFLDSVKEYISVAVTRLYRGNKRVIVVTFNVTSKVISPFVDWFVSHPTICLFLISSLIVGYTLYPIYAIVRASHDDYVSSELPIAGYVTRSILMNVKDNVGSVITETSTVANDVLKSSVQITHNAAQYSDYLYGNATDYGREVFDNVIEYGGDILDNASSVIGSNVITQTDYTGGIGTLMNNIRDSAIVQTVYVGTIGYIAPFTVFAIKYKNMMNDELPGHWGLY